MAKNMARLEEGVVTNIEWHSYGTPEAEDLVDCGEYSVKAGDTYWEDGFYRDGVKLLTPMQEMAERMADAETAVKILLGGAV